MKLTPIQQKALQWYVTENNLRPDISAHPMYYFTSKNTGGKQNTHIQTIVDWFEADKKRKARQAREEAKDKKKNDTASKV